MASIRLIRMWLTNGSSNDGRWMILPIIVSSDYPDPEATKPVQVGTAAT